MIVLNPFAPFPFAQVIQELKSFSKVFVLIERAVSHLQDSFSPFHVKVVEGGEGLKTLKMAETLFEEMAELGLDRHSAVLGVGGGALLDLTGFVSALFMRGIPFFSIPTTLLSQIDACYGGKTGVNLTSGKNLVGVFHQANQIWIYPPFLATQEKRSFRSGFAEMIKYAVIDDVSFFETLEEKAESLLALDFKELTPLIEKSLKIKEKFVLKDEKEKSVRAYLNFGHTIGHAIEAVTHYNTFFHGEAVAIGMCLEAKMSCDKGMFTLDEYHRLKALCQKFHLPTEYSSFEELIPFLKKDKKNLSEKVGFVLPKRIGSVELFHYPV